MKTSVTRGTLYLGIQQSIAVAAVAIMHIAAARILGPVVYGQLAVVLGLLSLVTAALLMGVPHAVSRFTAEDETRSAAVLRLGLTVQTVLASAIGAALFVLAPAIADALGDPGLKVALRTASVAVPLTGLVYVFAHALNGAGAFGKQAVTMGAFTVFKASAVVAALALGLGVEGAIRGVVLGAAVALALALATTLRAGLPTSGAADAPALGRFATQLTMTYIVIGIWESVDIIMLRALGQHANEVGYLGAVSALAAAPGSLFLPLIIVLFPSFARTVARNAAADAAHYLHTSLRYALIVMAPIVVGSFAIAEDLMLVLFGHEYVAAGVIVGPLVLGTSFYVSYELLDTFIRASGQARVSLAIAGTVVVTHVTLNTLLIPHLGLLAIVIAVVTTSFLALVAVAVSVSRSLHLQVAWATITKVLLGAIVAYSPFVIFEPARGLPAIALALLCGVVFTVGMIWSRVLGSEDYDRLRRLIAPPSRSTR